MFPVNGFVDGVDVIDIVNGLINTFIDDFVNYFVNAFVNYPVNSFNVTNGPVDDPISRPFNGLVDNPFDGRNVIIYFDDPAWELANGFFS